MIFVAIVWHEYTENEFDIWKYTIDILWYYLILHKNSWWFECDEKQ